MKLPFSIKETKDGIKEAKEHNSFPEGFNCRPIILWQGALNQISESEKKAFLGQNRNRKSKSKQDLQ